MEKKPKCLVCGEEYKPLMKLNGDVFCPNCENFVTLTEQQIFDTGITDKLRNSAELLMKELDKLGNHYPFLLRLLGSLNQSSKFLMNTRYNPYLIQKWVEYQYLIEKLNKFSLKDLSLTKIDKNIGIITNKLLNLARESLQNHRWITDVHNGEITFGYFKKDVRDPINSQFASMTMHYTEKVKFFATPKFTYEKIEKIIPIHYPGITLDFSGYLGNIMHIYERGKQISNRASKIFTDLTKNLSFDIFRLDNIENPIAFYQWIEFFSDQYDSIYGKFHGRYGLNRIEDLMFLRLSYLERFIRFQYTIMTLPIFFHLDFLQELLPEEAFVKGVLDCIEYLSTGEFHKCFFKIDDNLVFDIEHAKLFAEMINAQDEIINKKKRWEIRDYRSKTNFEQNTWQLGFHLNVMNILNSGKPMLNLKLKGPNGELEIDVCYLHDDTVHFIECKSDVALDLVTQEIYYRKMLGKIDLVYDYFKDQGYDIKSINPSLFSEICVKMPPKGLNVFISPIHLLEYFSKKYGLYKWCEGSLLESYPILARIGWENAFSLEHEAISLKYLIPNERYIMAIAQIHNLSINYISTIGKLIEIPKQSLYFNSDVFNLENSKYVLIIINETNGIILDHLFLPPYWQEKSTNTENAMESRDFHNTDAGRKFIFIAVLNGIYGYCAECTHIPLVPLINATRPSRTSAQSICVKCQKMYELERYDGYSFPLDEKLKQKVELALKNRFGNLY